MANKKRRQVRAGTIEERGGRFRVRMPGRGKERRILGTFDSQEEAEKMLNGALSILADGELERRDSHTLAGYGEQWLHRRELAGNRNIRTDVSRWERHIANSLIARKPLILLSRREVLAWIESLRTKRAAGPVSERRKSRRLSDSTIKHCLNLLRSCLQSAKDDELIAENPAREVKIKKSPSTEDGWTYLSLEEQSKLLGCEEIAEPDRLRIAFAIGTGLRQSEQWNLEWRDVHDTSDNPHIVVRYGSKRGPTKSGKIRRVPLFGIAQEAIRLWRESFSNYVKKNAAGLVFPLASGARRQRSKNYGWHECCQTAGITRHIRWHDLRHTFASSRAAGWWGRKWALDEIREVLGHSSVTMTERYSHLADSVLRQAAAETVGLGLLRPSSEVVPDAEILHDSGSSSSCDGATDTSGERGASTRQDSNPRSWKVSGVASEVRDTRSVPAVSQVAPTEHNPQPISPARHARFERTTFGFGGREASEERQQLSPILGHIGDTSHLRALSQQLLELAAAGDEGAIETAQALACVVGETLEPINRLVAAVMAGGPFTVRRALELVQHILHQTGGDRSDAQLLENRAVGSRRLPKTGDIALPRTKHDTFEVRLVFNLPQAG